MSLIQSVKKITARDVIGKVEKEDHTVGVMNDDGTPVLDANNQPVTRKVKVAVARDLFVVMGVARDHRIGRSQYGDSIVFTGNFEARRLSDGQVFVSTECIFPPIAQDMAISAYERAKALDPSAAVDFAFLIGVAPDARGSEGFKFTCKLTRAATSEADPLAELRSSLALDFAESLGAETMAKIGLMAPGETARQIEGPAKAKAKAEA